MGIEMIGVETIGSESYMDETEDPTRLRRRIRLCMVVVICCRPIIDLMSQVEIEDPFGHHYNDLALDMLTGTTITANLMELLERHRKTSNQVATISR